MKLILDREGQGYLIRNESEVVSRLVGSTFRHALERAERLARDQRTKLYITRSCLSDWFVGVPREGKPEIFRDTRLVFANEVPDQFKYVEGPFFDSEEASKACLKLTGEIGIVREG